MRAYISATGEFLPGDPIPNDRIEDYIGCVDDDPGTKEKVIKHSGIVTRHYAINKQQEAVYSSTKMAVEAIRDAISRSRISPDDIDLLALAASAGDLIAPGLASTVHAELEIPPCEIVSVHSFCASSMMALKYAASQVNAGEKKYAVAGAAEFPTRLLKSSRFAELRDSGQNGGVPFEAAFLRYMLADGAGAALIQDRPAESGPSYRIEWISVKSFANPHAACMQAGSASASAKSWLDYPTAQEAAADGAFLLRQNLKLLPRVVELAVQEYIRLTDEDMLDPDSITYFVDYNSGIMRAAAQAEFARRNRPPIAEDRWYSSIESTGMLGSAGIYVALHELHASGKLEPGNKVLCIVPEAGRMTIAYMLLTVVGPDRE